MAARDITLNLRPDRFNGAFIQSYKNGSALLLPSFSREEMVAFRVFFVEPSATGGLSAPLTVKDCAAYDCRIAIGTTAGVVLAEETLAWDTDHFSGVLNINTTQMNDALDEAAGAEISRVFEVELKKSDEEFTFQQSVTVRNEVLRADSGMPEDVTDSLFADSMEAALVDLPELPWTRVDNTLEGRAAVWRDATLSDTLRLECPPTVPEGVTAVDSTGEASVTVQGITDRVYNLEFRVRGLCVLMNYADGERFGYTYQGGTFAHGTSDAWWIEVSDPPQTIRLNATDDTPNDRQPLDYLLNVTARAGATITLKYDTQDGAISPFVADAPVPGVDPYPATFDGHFLELTLLNPNLASPASLQQESFSAAGNTDIEPETNSRHHAAVITAGAGAGGYTRTLALLTANRKRGDVALLRLSLPASVNPTIQVRNATSGGTLLATVAGLASGMDFAVVCIFDGSAWILGSVGPDTTAAVTAHASTHASGGSDPVLTAKLEALSALTWVSNTLPIFTGAGTVSTVAASAFEAAGLSLPYTGGTMTGQINFSGTTHAGIKLISLTTTQRNALTAANGMLIYNTTSAKVQKYEGGAWADVAAGALQLYVENPSTPTVPTAAGTNGVAIGYGAAASGNLSVCLSMLGESAAAYSFATGKNAKAKNYGEHAHASGQTTNAGDSQSCTKICRAITTDGSQSEIFLDGSVASERAALANNSSWAFKILLVARRTDADGENDAWEFNGLIHRDANAASTSLDALQENQIGATAWAVAVDADTTNGSLRIQVTGEAAKTIRWVATITTSEVTN
jgi:hypothetical protein